jgi:uncharacterized protein (TIGR02145 family)
MGNRILYLPAKGYGILYNWYAIIDTSEIAPSGFHVANESDWASLLGYLGGLSGSGGSLKAFSNWEAPNTGASNSQGFNCTPSGKRNPDGSFEGKKTMSYHWIKNINT